MLHLCQRWIKLVIFAISCAYVTTSVADDMLLRKVYLQAEKQVWNADSSSYKNLYQQLHYYPLQPYLDQKRLMTKMRLSAVGEINQFLTKYKGTPLDWPLRKKWLHYLAKRNKQQLFQQFYIANGSAELNCQYYRYQLNSGIAPAKILPKVTKLWLVGKSQPKVCDPLFKQWQQAGYRTENVIWQRIVLAADGGKHTLIPYLTKLLPKEQQYLAKLWHKVRRDPAYITKLSRFKNKSQREAQIISYGLKRLIWRAPNRALDTYKLAKAMLPLTDEQHREITLRFALALASKKHQAANAWLNKVADQDFNSNLTQWYIADLLRTENWQQINNKLSALPKSVKGSLQWQYWHARSLQGIGLEQQGRKLLTQLANSRHYYGFLAASHIGQPANFKNKPLQVTEQEKALIIKSPAAKRAFELFAIGRFHQARKEWNYWLAKLNKRDKLVASKIANEMDWYDRAIFTLANVGYLDDVNLRFPLAYAKEIEKYADDQKINPAWAYAITRRESSFMSDAHSSAGAKGLMQLMPATAKQLARRKVSNKYLLNANNNIKLGTKYLRKLLDRHNGNPILATAAYNAGPHRVKSWLKGSKPMPADVWIETIPFKETREYVKSVMAYQQIYQRKTGQSASLFDQIITMNISL